MDQILVGVWVVERRKPKALASDCALEYGALDDEESHGAHSIPLKSSSLCPSLPLILLLMLLGRWGNFNVSLVLLGYV